MLRCAIVSALLLWAVPVFAIPPFNEVFKKMYVEPGGPLEAKVAELKCNVCHDGKMKAARNDFGKTVGKHLSKADFYGPAKKFLNPKDPLAQEAMRKGIEDATAEEYKDGKTYRQLIEKAELPFATPVRAASELPDGR